jgi:hypothetical protein
MILWLVTYLIGNCKVRVCPLHMFVLWSLGIAMFHTYNLREVVAGSSAYLFMFHPIGDVDLNITFDTPTLR